MNKVILMGRLTRDPEVRQTTGAAPMTVCRYTLAVDRSYKREGEPEADFFNIVAFGKRGDFAGKYFRKGMQVAVVGELRNNNYTGKDGTKHYTVEIVAQEQYFADSGKAEPKPPAGQEDGFTPVDEDLESDEGLPF